MPTCKPRLALSLPEDVCNKLNAISKRNNMPQSKVALKLIEDALELQEDVLLADFVEERLKNSDFISHDEVWR